MHCENCGLPITDGMRICVDCLNDLGDDDYDDDYYYDNWDYGDWDYGEYDYDHYPVSLTIGQKIGNWIRRFKWWLRLKIDPHCVDDVPF